MRCVNQSTSATVTPESTRDHLACDSVTLASGGLTSNRLCCYSTSLLTRSQMLTLLEALIGADMQF